MSNKNKVVVNFNGNESLNKYSPIFFAEESDIVSTIISNPNDFEIKVRFLVDKFNTEGTANTSCSQGTLTHENIIKQSVAMQKSKSLLWDYSIPPNDYTMLRHLRMEPGDASFVYINSENPNTQAKAEVSSQIERRTATSSDTLINNVSSSINNTSNKINDLIENSNNLNATLIESLSRIANALEAANQLAITTNEILTAIKDKP